MLAKKFKVVEIQKNGVAVTHFMSFKKRKERAGMIKQLRNGARRYEMFLNGMIVWA